MKKILRFYLPIFIILLSLSFLFFIYMIKNHSVLIKYVFGMARLHSETVNSIVKIDGKEQTDVKVFKLDNEKWLVYSPTFKNGTRVIIVDKSSYDIASTNASEKDYELIFDNYLFQADSAYGLIYASSAKWELKPNLEITDSRISYTTRKLENDKLVDVQTEILFKGE
jgi:hypothetical protein